MKTGLAIRNSLIAFAQFLLSILKIIFLSKWSVKFPERKGEHIAVLANGPSLTNALEKMKQEGIPSQVMVTNFFCDSELYTELKPNHYVICDPSFFDLTEEAPQFKKFYFILFEKTSWELNLFIPFNQLKKVHEILRKFNLSNNHIHFYGYNVINFNGDNWFNYSFFKRSLGMPRPTTVAVPAMMLAIQMGYKKIQIAGIDLNQHESILVDENNQLMIKHRHFSTTEEKLVPFYKNKKTEQLFTVSEIFLIFHRFFYSFDIIAKFAIYQGVEIVNYSTESFLDQFKKA